MNEKYSKYDRKAMNKLVAKAINMDKSKVFFDYTEIELNFIQSLKLNKYVHDFFIKKIPMEYILGYTFFYNEEYFVNKNVLIPRGDTETLVAAAIEIINNNKFKTCLDLCCGSGTVGISTACNSNIENVDLTDISKKAIKVANINIKKNNAIKCNAFTSNLFNNVKDKYDIIVSNPPYVRNEYKDELEDNSSKHEPKIAFYGGDDGLVFYNKIISNCHNYLNENGYILLEIGFDQKDEVLSIVRENKNLKFIEVIKDIKGFDRVVICRFQAK